MQNTGMSHEKKPMATENCEKKGTVKTQVRHDKSANEARKNEL